MVPNVRCGGHLTQIGRGSKEQVEMMFVLVAVVWVVCSIPVSLVLARVVRTHEAELYGMDDSDVIYRYPNGSIERVALFQPTVRQS
jgi:MFS-type transporter involved in bile tolerance (Atg22 family)